MDAAHADDSVEFDSQYAEDSDRQKWDTLCHEHDKAEDDEIAGITASRAMFAPVGAEGEDRAVDTAAVDAYVPVRVAKNTKVVGAEAGFVPFRATDRQADRGITKGRSKGKPSAGACERTVGPSKPTRRGTVIVIPGQVLRRE
jgi:hypothetical protein